MSSAINKCQINFPTVSLEQLEAAYYLSNPELTCYLKHIICSIQLSFLFGELS